MAKEIVISENRDFKGVWIYKNLYLSREYTPNEKFLLLEIYSLSKGKNKQCYANNRHFADFIGVKENTIQKAILKLEKNGHIRREYTYKNGTREIASRIITLTQKFYDDFINESEIKEQEEGVDKNPWGGGLESIHKYNNISITNNAFSLKEKGTLCFSPEKAVGQSNVKYRIEDVPYLVGQYAEPNTLGSRIIDLRNIILYFIDRYNENSNTRHIDVSDSAIKSIVDAYFHPTGKVVDCEAEDYIWMIDDYFATDYKMNGRRVSKSLQHFFSGKIRENICMKRI